MTTPRFLQHTDDRWAVRYLDGADWHVYDARGRWLGAIQSGDHEGWTEAVLVRADPIHAVIQLHHPWQLYDECGHTHTPDEVDTSQAIEIAEVGRTCQAGYLHTICRHCCAADGVGQTEDCAAHHDHRGPGWCPTTAALAVAGVDIQAGDR